MANTNMERCLPSLMFIQTEVYVWEGKWRQLLLSLPHRIMKLMREFLRKHFICFSKHTVFGGSVPRN